MTVRHVTEWVLTIFAALGAFGLESRASDDEPAKKRARAPADYQIVSSDRAGAYFVARPLKDRYDKLVGQLAALRLDIAEARITSDEARRRVDQLSAELAALKQQIEEAKIYIPGATVHTAKTTESLPIAPSDFLLVDAPNVELRGWEKPDVCWVLEKTVLSLDGKGVAEELKAITVAHRKATGKELFGFYKNIAGKPESKNDWDRFLFKDYLEREFVYIKIVGLVADEGNGQISVEVTNEQGDGEMSSQWRRQAKLILYMPKCGRVGVRGALAGFKATGVTALLAVLGEGDRDYHASYEVSKLTGSLSADNIAMDRIDGVRGDVSIVATAFAANLSTTHDDRGTTIEPGTVPSADYRNIDGDLRVRFVRTDLTIGRVSGQIDVENDFGHTSWVAENIPGKHAHRIVTQRGTIEVRLNSTALGELPLALFSECGIVRVASGMDQGLKNVMFSSSSGDNAYRSWHGFTTGQTPSAAPLALFERATAALHGRTREPGVDLISRAGTIQLLPARP
jgi:hypothetical protein